MKASRNALCPCGSGRKYKHCCGGKTPWYKKPTVTGALILLVLLCAALIAWSAMSDASENRDAQGKVWSPEHGHYH